MRGLVVKSTGSWYKVLASCPPRQAVPPSLPAAAPAASVAAPAAVGTPAAAGTPASFGEEYDCRLRGSFRLHDNKQTNPIAVGDWVEFSLEPDGTGVITQVDDRRNCIIRQATKLSKQTHVIAANVDCLCVVATLAPPLTPLGFVDRLLVTAEAYRIPALLLFNKSDLYTPLQWQELARLQSRYALAGYPLFPVSALCGQGLEAVAARLRGLTVLFAGHSGVGKSALLNALDPTLQLRVGAVSDWSLKGRHTTTCAQLHPFAGGFLIDTPGIKEFGMVDIKEEELSLFFPEMRALLPYCRFANCTHRHEPHCAVKEAVEQGRLSQERYESYLRILASLEEAHAFRRS